MVLCLCPTRRYETILRRNRDPPGVLWLQAMSPKEWLHLLAEELKKGVPLNYRDELGRNILEYPDGHIEITQDVIPPYIQNQMKPCNHDW